MTETSGSTLKRADKDGEFRRRPSSFRDVISKDPSSEFPAEANRYALYMNHGCPWAHRAVLVRALKGLDEIIEMIPTGLDLTNDGWLFTGKHGSANRDPLYGLTRTKQLYLKADPEYQGRYSVPVLWDKKNETIVNNESSEIIRMFYTEFDHLLDPAIREVNRTGGGFLPAQLKDEIEAMNEWVYTTVNNGVYRVGFSSTQEAYDSAIGLLFASLDRLEAHLEPSNSANHGGPYLFGQHITEADVRLYTTLIRFDAAYYAIFVCSRKMIRHDYPNLYRWLRRLYWRGGEAFSTTDKDRTSVFSETSDFAAYRYGYTRAKQRSTGQSEDKFIVPVGPVVDIDPLED